MSARDKAIAIAVGIVLTGMLVAAVLDPIYDVPNYTYQGTP